MLDEIVDRDTFPAVNLTNAIHPLFRSNKFQRNTVEYPVIETSCRLASKLIQSHTVQGLLWTIAKHQQPLENLGGREVGYTADDTANVVLNSRGAKTHVRMALRELARLIKFVPDNEVDNGLTRPTGRPTTRSAAFSDQQRRSLVRFGGELYKSLREAHHAARPDAVHLRALQFELAVTLAHEVVHALVNAAEGYLNREPFLHGASLAEVGFEAEQRWFGGHLARKFWLLETVHPSGRVTKGRLRRHRYRPLANGRGPPSALEGVWVLMGYPNMHLVTAYRVADAYMGTRNLGEVKEPCLGWRVPMTWIAGLFSDEFWRRVEDLDDATTTLAPQEVNQYFQHDDEANLETVKPVADLPKGYKRATEGWNIDRTMAKRKSNRGPKKGTKTRNQENML